MVSTRRQAGSAPDAIAAAGVPAGKTHAVSMSKRRATTTLKYVAADLGLNVTGIWPGTKRAHGRYLGIELGVTLTSDGRPSADDREKDNAAGLADDWWMLAATTTHTDLGCGFAISGPARVSIPLESGAPISTGDAGFDATVALRVADRDQALTFLDEPTRGVIKAFFESGIEALITDTQILINPQLTARALASRLRNGARMSRLLQTRLAALAPPPPPEEPN
jgi:hypothetical protein